MESRYGHHNRPLIGTIGSIDMGFGTAIHAWNRVRHVFHCHRGSHPIDVPGTCNDGTLERLPRNYLVQHPVECLLVGRHSAPTYTDRIWSMVKATDSKPRLIVELWQTGVSYHEQGPLCKATRVRWEEIGYGTRCQLVRASEVGSSLDHAKLVVVRTMQSRDDFRWPDAQLESVLRPMANCLLPVGVPKNAFRVGSPTGREPRAQEDLMPGSSGQVIVVDGKRRRLLDEELAKGLGVPKGWFKSGKNRREMLKETTSIHILEYLTPLLETTIRAEQSEDDTGPPNTDRNEPLPAHTETQVPFSWVPPDLSIGSDFYKARVHSLKKAAAAYPNPEEIIEDGLTILRRHRENYTATHPDPKCLQLIWWEFPKEHWEALRVGSSMNFLQPPVEGLWLNSKMDEEQKDVAAEFVDELVELGVLEESTINKEVKSICPLFCVEKAGQPGQWRCIADMKAGRQNEAIGADPTVFPKSTTVLQQMYTGGFSAVVDASKFFHQFSTVENERKWLGMRHPKSDKLYRYTGLPMGSGSSPGLAGRYGNAFIRKLRTECPAFREENGATVNTWWQQFGNNQKMDEKLGFGRFGLGLDGLPVTFAWAHCDDFLLHGPTYEKTCEALSQFLDKTVEVGLLCHPKKLIPPSQLLNTVASSSTPQRSPPYGFLLTNERDVWRSSMTFFIAIDLYQGMHWRLPSEY
jgi:hypothetical protein